MIVAAQLLSDIATNLLIVVNYQNLIAVLRALACCLLFLLNLQQLFFLQMFAAQRQVNGEHTSLLVAAIGGLDSAMMHLNHHLAQVQSDTCALDMHATRAGTLIETVEELAWIALDAHTIINHLQDSALVLSILRYTHLNLTAIVGVLKGV